VTDAARRPLEGRRVVVTRRPEQASALVEGLEALGATVLAVPAIEIAPPEDPGPLDDALKRLRDFDGLLLTSPNAVASIASRLQALGLPPEDLATVEVAVVGTATAAELGRRFPSLPAPLHPEHDFRAEALLARIVAGDVTGRRYLLPASDRARDVLGAGLEAAGAAVERVVAYRTVTPANLVEAVSAALDAHPDLAVFASPSAVEALVSAAANRVSSVPAAVIGPVTEAAARAAGLRVVAVASPSTTEGLLSAVSRCFARSGQTD
jgi:uroporphyrinogen-III synthase